MSYAQKIADKVRTAMVEAWDDATGYERPFVGAPYEKACEGTGKKP